MKLCDDHRGGIEIVYDGSVCPLCDALRQIDEWEREGSDKNEKIASLEKEIEELKNAHA